MCLLGSEGDTCLTKNNELCISALILAEIHSSFYYKKLKKLKNLLTNTSNLDIISISNYDISSQDSQASWRTHNGRTNQANIRSYD